MDRLDNGLGHILRGRGAADIGRRDAGAGDFSTARISRAEASASPRWSSICDAVQKLATGLAMPLPVMSNAEPWIGSNIDGKRRWGSMFAVGATPRLPASAPARSDRMSAWRFVATMVSRLCG